MLAQMKVGTKLIVGFLVLVIIGAVVAVIGIVNMGKINDMAEAMYERELIGLSHIKEANINLIYIGRARSNYLLSTTSEERETHRNNIRKFVGAMTDNLDKAKPLFVTDAAKRIFSEYATVASAYDTEMSRVFALADKETLTERSDALSQALVETRKHASRLDDMLSALSKQKEERAKAEAVETAERYASSRSMMLYLTLLSAISGLALGILITRNLTGQLGGEPTEAARIAKQIACGDLNVNIAVKPGDTW